MKQFVFMLLSVYASSSAVFPDYDKAEFEFSYGFRDPRLYGNDKHIDKILADPSMKPADFSRALTYLCQAMGKSAYTKFEDDQKKYCIPIAEKLLAKGAKINTVNKADTALRSSMRSHSVVYFDYLIKKGADPNLANADGETPLMYAVYLEPYSSYNFITHVSECHFTEALLKAGAKVNAKDKKGRTALHVAAAGGGRDAADRLIKHRAALDAKDKDGLTPIQIAQIENKDALVRDLKSAGAKETPLPAKYQAKRQKNAEDKKKSDAAAEVAEAKEKVRKKSEANELYANELRGLKARLDAKAAEIQRVEAEMSAIGWSSPSFSGKTVTGYKCDVNNQNCRATDQGGGETGSSYWRRSDNEQKKRSLERQHSILVNEYDSLVYKYNEILKKMQQP